jgi:hypothetical protein
MSNLIFTPEAGSPRWLAVALLVGRLSLVAFFLFMAARNLAGDVGMAADFRRWGYPDWFRVATALAQIAGALLLVDPRTVFFGSGILTGVLVGAICTHLRFDPAPTALSPAVFLVPVLWLLVVFRPPLFR